MKKRLTAAALLLSAVLTLSGCYQTGEKEISSNQMSDTISPVGGEKIEFNYEISPDFPTKVPKIKLNPKNLDTELIKNVLLHDKNITETIEAGVRKIYNTSDGSNLTIVGNSFYFTDMNVVADPKDFGNVVTRYRDLSYSSGEELKAFSRQNAVARVNKILDEFGVENYGEPYIIPVTPETGNFILENYGSFGREEYTLWNEDDGVYILRYPLNVNGIDASIKNMRMAGTGKTILGEDILAFVTKDSIFNIEANALYDVISADEGTVDIKCNAEYASNALINYYSKLILQYPTFFTDCRLEYIPGEITSDEEYIFVPAWCFSGYRLKGPDLDMQEYFAEYYYVDTGIRYLGY